jgi:hypothetical protein
MGRWGAEGAARFVGRTDAVLSVSLSAMNLRLRAPCVCRLVRGSGKPFDIIAPARATVTFSP